MEFERNGLRLFYTKTGQGAENLLLFHGFGQDRSAFGSLVSKVSDRFTCYSFDLFFHGADSQTPYTRPLTRAKWVDLLSAFLDHENIDRFSLAGFSIGARLVITALPALAPRLNTLFLIAPEGITTNIWYQLATSTPPGRYFFGKLIEHPNWFSRAATTAQNTGLLPAKVGRFAKLLMDSELKRRRVWTTWMMLSQLKVPQSELASVLNQSNVKLVLILGNRDRIISAEKIKRFLQRLETSPELHIIDSAHITMIRVISESYSHLFTTSGDSPRRSEPEEVR